MFKRRCCGCGQRKNKQECYIPVGNGVYYCQHCALDTGMIGRLNNRAEKNSKEWREGPCPHQTWITQDYRRHRTMYRRAICTQRTGCGAVIWDVKTGPYRGL